VVAVVRPLAPALALALTLALALVAPCAAARDLDDCAPQFGVVACAGESSDAPDCGRDFADVEAGHVGASVSGERYCGDDGTRGDLFHAAVLDGTGREAIRWESVSTPSGDYRELQIERAPDFVDWYEDSTGCAMLVAVAPILPGADHGCIAGPPPTSPALAWGQLLP
jgi:hypothetical protein